MQKGQMFAVENFFGKYEQIIRTQIGEELDDFKHLLSQIDNKCTARMMNIDFDRAKGIPVMVDDLTKCDFEFRDKILSALLYNDALWRLESAHLMMCIGLLNIAYSNLRGSVELLQTAFIVERSNDESLKFLRNKEVNLNLIDSLLINPEYSTYLRDMKELCSVLGVHGYLSSIQLSSLFGVNRFNKYLIENTKMESKLQLPMGFVDAAKEFIRHGVQVGMLFLWLESLPTEQQDDLRDLSPED